MCSSNLVAHLEGLRDRSESLSDLIGGNLQPLGGKLHAHQKFVRLFIGMMIRIENVPAVVVNEARDPGYNAPAILAMNQEDNRFFSMCHRGPSIPDESDLLDFSRQVTMPAENDAM